MITQDVTKRLIPLFILFASASVADIQLRNTMDIPDQQSGWEGSKGGLSVSFTLFEVGHCGRPLLPPKVNQQM